MNRMPARIFVSTPDLRPSLLSILEGFANTGMLARIATTISFSPRLIERLSAIPMTRRWLAPHLKRSDVPPCLTGKIDNIWCRELVRRVSSRVANSSTTHAV
jgi:hypothetical protein